MPRNSEAQQSLVRLLSLLAVCANIAVLSAAPVWRSLLAKEAFNLAHPTDLNWLNQKGSLRSLFA